MDRQNYKDILKLADNSQKHKVRMILDDDQEVPDPYFGEIDGFEKVYKMLDESCEILAEKIRNKII